jgi:hypothetical protein
LQLVEEALVLLLQLEIILPYMVVMAPTHRHLILLQSVAEQAELVCTVAANLPVAMAAQAVLVAVVLDILVVRAEQELQAKVLVVVTIQVTIMEAAVAAQEPLV